MNKVLQSAGRVIRTKEDRGIVLLLDERFLQRAYRELFPVEWGGYEICSLEDERGRVEEFWGDVYGDGKSTSLPPPAPWISLGLAGREV